MKKPPFFTPFGRLVALALIATQSFAFSAHVENDNDDGTGELDTWGSANSFSFSGSDLASIWSWGGVWQGRVTVYADDDVMGLCGFGNPPITYTTSSSHSPGTYGNDIVSGRATWGKTFTEFETWLDFYSSSKNSYGP